MTDTITEDVIITQMIDPTKPEDREITVLTIYAIITICATACDKFKQVTEAKQKPTTSNVGITIEDVVENINKIKFADKRLQFRYDDKEHRQMLLDGVAALHADGMCSFAGPDCKYLIPHPTLLYYSSNVICNTNCLETELSMLASAIVNLRNN